MSLGAAAVRVSLATSKRAHLAIGAALLCLGICGLHFTGMGALRLEPTPLLEGPHKLLSSWWLALAIASAAAVILAAAAVGMAVDHHFASRAAREAQRLRALVDATFEGIVIQAGGVVLDTNASLLQLLGQSRAEVVGSSVAGLFSADTSASASLYLESERSSAFRAELLR